jgi:DNA-binding MarR family transcriptional regulator
VDAVTDAVLTASRLLLAISARSIAAVEESVTLPQFRLLVVLDTQGPLKLSALAEQLGVNPSTATRMVDRLIATGTVARDVNPASRREVVVDLTAAGGRLVRQVTEQRRREISTVVARMPARSRRGLVAALTAFADAGGEPSPGRVPVHDPGVSGESQGRPQDRR